VVIVHLPFIFYFLEFTGKLIQKKKIAMLSFLTLIILSSPLIVLSFLIQYLEDWAEYERELKRISDASRGPDIYTFSREVLQEIRDNIRIERMKWRIKGPFVSTLKFFRKMLWKIIRAYNSFRIARKKG